MKRVLVWCLAFALLFGLTACKPGAKNGEDSSDEVVDTTRTSEPGVIEATEPEATEAPKDSIDEKLLASETIDSYKLAWPADFDFFRPAENPEGRALEGIIFTAPYRQVRRGESFQFVPELLAKDLVLSDDGLRAELYFREQPIAEGLPVVSAADYHQYIKELLSARRENPLARRIIDELCIVGAHEYYRGAKYNNTNPQELANWRTELIGKLEEQGLLGELGPSLGVIVEVNKAEETGTDTDQHLGETEESEATEPDKPEEDADEQAEQETEVSAEAKLQLIAEIEDYLKAESRNFSARVNQKVYDQLPKKRPYWATVGVTLEDDDEGIEYLVLEFSRPISKLKLMKELSQHGILAYRGGLERKNFDRIMDGDYEGELFSELEKIGFVLPGPYAIEELSDKSLLLKQRKNFTNGVSLPDRILFRKFANQDAMAEAFNSAEITEYYYKDVFQMDLNHPGLVKLPSSIWGVYINCEGRNDSPYLQSLELRTALRKSIHRDYIVNSIMPQMKATTVLLNDAVLDPFDTDKNYRDSLEARGNIAANNGLDLLNSENSFQVALNNYGMSKFELELCFPEGSEELELVAGELKSQWEVYFKPERLVVKLRPLPTEEFWRALSLADYDLALAPFDVDPYDALRAFAAFTAAGPGNIPAFASKDYSDLYANLAAREGLLSDNEWRNGVAMLEHQLLESGAIVPLFETRDFAVMGELAQSGTSYLPALDFRSY